MLAPHVTLTLVLTYLTLTLTVTFTDARLMEIESRLLPCGLHVVGSPPTAAEAVATLVNIAGGHLSHILSKL